ncbi:hypothetical protein C8Q73DRAFT_710334 [Cubamyces lactineus]|nr:hypothetical protein C8Q73DRAFT_710334 [Cubamyces lactineus]
MALPVWSMHGRNYRLEATGVSLKVELVGALFGRAMVLVSGEHFPQCAIGWLDGWQRYWGRHFLINHPSVRTIKHTGSFPLKRLGGGPVITARFVRCLTGHAPTGSYRLRFRTRLEEPTFCSLHDGDPMMHTREHVLFRCDHYIRRYRHSPIEDLLQSLDPFYDIVQFLADNPSALTFDDLPTA